jgi:hypothetical protein
MSKYYIPTIEQLMNNNTGFVKTTFNPTHKMIWNEKYSFELFKNFETNDFSIISSTKTKSYYGEKHNKYIKLIIDKNNQILKYSSYDGSISSIHNESITYNNKPYISYYYIPIMRKNILIDLIKITKDWDIRDKKQLIEIGKKYNLENELKRFINKS